MIVGSGEEVRPGAIGRLQGKVALVTGSGSSDAGVGTGAATARLFAREGADVCVVDQDPERADHTSDAIAADGGSALALTGDITNPDHCGRIVREAVSARGGIDILVNNVAVGGRLAVGEIDEATWDRTFDVNLKSVVRLCQQVIPVMRDGEGGSIINISSIAALRANGGSAYGASKAAMIALSRDMAVAYGRLGIRVNVIAPGHLWTPFLGAMPAEHRARRRDVSPLGIEGTSWDVAWTAVFLASNEARYITGAVIPVDGGVTQVAPLTAYDLITTGGVQADPRRVTNASPSAGQAP